VSRPGVSKVAARLGEMKLIVNHDAHWDESSRIELYDVEAAPGETHNLASRRPVLVRYLQHRLWERQREQTALRERLQGGRRLELTQQEQERLRALGYIE
jgi:hypothetical protein